MRVWITLLLLLAPLTQLPNAEAASWAERKSACKKFLRLTKPQQVKIARPTGFSADQHRRACRDLLNGHIREEKPRYTNPAWYGTSCTVTRDCYAGQNCIGRMCKPASYGGCGTGIDSCPAGESCVNGACR